MEIQEGALYMAGTILMIGAILLKTCEKEVKIFLIKTAGKMKRTLQALFL